MATLIELRGLSVAFAGRPVLQGIDATFPAGAISFVVGRSGVGKTTLLRALNRLNELYPGCVTTGTVRLQRGPGVQDVHASSTDVAALRRRVGMVFQTPNVLPASIERNMTLALRHALGLGKDAARARMLQALAEAELLDEVHDRLHANAMTLSGGQQQRLCLARTLALQPDVLLLDEPTASLDYRATARIEALLQRLKARYTIVAVSHSLGQTSRLADHCLLLRDGGGVRAIGGAALRDPAHLRELVDEAF